MVLAFAVEANISNETFALAILLDYCLHPPKCRLINLGSGLGINFNQVVQVFDMRQRHESHFWEEIIRQTPILMSYTDHVVIQLQDHVCSVQASLVLKPVDFEIGTLEVYCLEFNVTRSG